jgi:hypothetical protein
MRVKAWIRCFLEAEEVAHLRRLWQRRQQPDRGGVDHAAATPLRVRDISRARSRPASPASISACMLVNTGSRRRRRGEIDDPAIAVYQRADALGAGGTNVTSLMLSSRPQSLAAILIIRIIVFH